MLWIYINVYGHLKRSAPNAPKRGPRAFCESMFSLLLSDGKKMPKSARSARQKITAAVSHYGEKVFLLETNNGKHALFCRACSVHVAHDDSGRIKQHVATATHQKNAAEASKVDDEVVEVRDPETGQHSGSTLQVPLPVLLDEEAQGRAEQREFQRDLTEAFLSADIPFQKLSNEKLKAFLQKPYKNRHVPDPSTLRKYYVEPCYKNKLDEIRQALSGKYVNVSLDESVDSQKRSVVNVSIRSRW